MGRATFDVNNRTTILGVDSNAFVTPIEVAVDPVTHEMLVKADITASIESNINIDKFGGTSVTIGQQLAAASIPVILPAATITTLTPPAAITGFATSAKQDTGNTSLASIDGKITAVNTGAVVVASGSITVANASGGSAVNIQDGGNSITVDGTVTANISGSISNTSFASTIADGADVTLGAKADAKSTATDTTPISVVSILKQISASVQAPPSQAVTITSGTVTTVSTVSNISQIASTTPTFGDVNNAAAEAGALNETPIGRYNATLPTITDTRYNQLQIGSRGSLHAELWATDAATPILSLDDNSDTLAASATANKIPVIARNTVWDNNGALWDRQRIADPVNGINTSTGRGTVAAGVYMHFDDVSPAAATENNLALPRISSRREVYNQIRDAAGNERGLNVDANGGIAITLESSQTLATVTTVSTVTNLSQMNGVAISMGVGATGTGTQRVVLPNDAGRTLVSKGGSASSSGDNTLVAAGTNKLKVYAFSLSTVSTTAVTCIFQSGAAGTELWRVILQTPASVAGGANLVVQPPAWLFATASATLLNLNLSAAVTVHWSVSYYDEA